MNTTPAVQSDRPLYVIAADILSAWKPVYFGAKPYLEAMTEMDNLADVYIGESGSMIVNYFLSNATTWRGDDARRIKAELNRMMKNQNKRK